MVCASCHSVQQSAPLQINLRYNVLVVLQHMLFTTWSSSNLLCSPWRVFCFWDSGKCLFYSFLNSKHKNFIPALTPQKTLLKPNPSFGLPDYCFNCNFSETVLSVFLIFIQFLLCEDHIFSSNCIQEIDYLILTLLIDVTFALNIVHKNNI